MVTVVGDLEEATVGEGHGELLSAADTALLAMESDTLPMHSGGVFVFEQGDGAAFEFARFVELVRSRLHRLPRHRQRLVSTPMAPTNPVWVDDTRFDLAHHLRHTALPSPGGIGQLTEYAGRVLSRPLERDRPLWELYVVDGVAEDRFAIIGKSHQVMLDGPADLDIASVLFDLDPHEAGDIAPPVPWTPAPTPGPAQRVWTSAKQAVTSPAALVRSVGRAAASPVANVRRLLRTGRGVAGVARSTLSRPGARTVVNGRPGPRRRLVAHRVPLAEVGAVKDAFGTSVHDVVLAMVADMTGRYLRRRGTDTDGLWLRVLVPVSVRAPDDDTRFGSRVVSLFVELPMFEMDPVERLLTCRDRMTELTEGRRAVGAGVLAGLPSFAPPTLHAMASRVAARGGLFNFLVANVPGPQSEVHCLGARLQAAFPYLPLGPSSCYAVGVTSTKGWLNVCVTADGEALTDVEVVTGYLDDALADLTASAEAKDYRSELAGRAPREIPPAG